MEIDDEAARKARADGLMREIEQLTSRQPITNPEGEENQTSGKDDEEAATPAESPREFIHRRMRELDQDKDSDLDQPA